MKYKFRGMSVETKEWVYGDLIHNGYDRTSRMIPIGIAQQRSYPIEVIPETVGMWIGKYDRNGDEVYEGDIMEHDSGLVPKGTNTRIKTDVKWNKRDLCIDGYRSDGVVVSNIYEMEKKL